MSSYIDWDVFGALVRCYRYKLGFRKCDEFADAIEKSTGVHIPFTTIYKIESGKQMASVEQMFAILAMFDMDAKKRIMCLCMPDAKTAKVVMAHA